MRIGSLVVTWGKQRFGLPQAEAAMKFAKDAGQVGAVLGTVVGVLGYENAVAADVAEANTAIRVNIAESKVDIATSESEINVLRRRIALLEGQIDTSTRRQAQLAEVAKLFGGK